MRVWGMVAPFCRFAIPPLVGAATLRFLWVVVFRPFRGLPPPSRSGLVGFGIRGGKVLGFSG